MPTSGAADVTDRQIISSSAKERIGIHLDRRKSKTGPESARKLPPGNCFKVSHLHS